jgi:hypothetical protein
LSPPLIARFRDADSQTRDIDVAPLQRQYFAFAQTRTRGQKRRIFPGRCHFIDDAADEFGRRNFYPRSRYLRERQMLGRIVGDHTFAERIIEDQAERREQVSPVLWTPVWRDLLKHCFDLARRDLPDPKFAERGNQMLVNVSLR